MIEYFLILIFTFSPINEEPRTYEIYTILDDFAHCNKLSEDLKKYSKETENFKISGQCVILETQSTFSHKISNKDKRKIYDPYGKYQGSITKGKIYSPYGKYKGKIEPSGKIYDPYGKYLGTIK